MITLGAAGTVMAIIGGILAIAAIAGIVWARIRSSSDETTAALWKDEAEAWKARALRLDEALLSLEKRVDNLESENQMLRALHDSREEMNALRDATVQGFSQMATLLALQCGKDGN